MVIKANNGVYRQGLKGAEPNIGAEGSKRYTADDEPYRGKRKVVLIRRAGRWIVYEETAYNFSINVIEDMRRFHSVTSKEEVFRKYDEWAGGEDARRNRRLDGGY